MRAGGNRRAGGGARPGAYGPTAMVEEYHPGRELTVGVMGDRALAVTEIAASTAILRLRVRNTPTAARATSSRRRSHPAVYARALDIALAAHRALGCRGASRADFRYDDTAGEPGRLVLLEVEHPARPDADLPAAGAGGASSACRSRSCAPGWWRTPHVE
jgi:D-alanine-D-alanine ligase